MGRRRADIETVRCVWGAATIDRVTGFGCDPQNVDQPDGASDVPPLGRLEDVVVSDAPPSTTQFVIDGDQFEGGATLGTGE